MSLPFLSQASHISETQSTTESPSQEQQLRSPERPPQQAPQESGNSATPILYREEEQHLRQTGQEQEEEGVSESKRKSEPVSKQEAGSVSESESESERNAQPEQECQSTVEQEQYVQQQRLQRGSDHSLLNQPSGSKPSLEKQSSKPVLSVRPVRGDTLWQRQLPFKTGSIALDDALRSGLTQGRVIQLCGQTLSGKSLLAASFAANVLRDDGGVVWFETTNSPWEVKTRISSLLRANAGDSDKSWPLAVFAVPTFNSAMYTLSTVHNDIALLRALPSAIQELPGHGFALRNALGRLRLVVFDSAASILSPLLGLRIPPAWSGHVALDHICAALRWFTVHTSATVIITNRVVLSTGATYPALGNKWASFVDVDAILCRDNSSSEQVRAEDEPHTSTATVAVSVQSKRDWPRSCQIVLDKNGARDMPPR